MKFCLLVGLFICTCTGPPPTAEVKNSGDPYIIWVMPHLAVGDPYLLTVSTPPLPNFGVGRLVCQIITHLPLCYIFPGGAETFRKRAPDM